MEEARPERPFLKNHLEEQAVGALAKSPGDTGKSGLLFGKLLCVMEGGSRATRASPGNEGTAPQRSSVSGMRVRGGRRGGRWKRVLSKITESSAARTLGWEGSFSPLTLTATRNHICGLRLHGNGTFLTFSLGRSCNSVTLIYLCAFVFWFLVFGGFFAVSASNVHVPKGEKPPRS